MQRRLRTHVSVSRQKKRHHFWGKEWWTWATNKDWDILLFW